METRTLRAKMVMQGASVDALCKVTGISKTAFYRKIKGESEFTQGEIGSIAAFLQLTKEELCCIFFSLN